MRHELLIATNGFKGTWPAIEYGAWLAELVKGKVTLLGVSESFATKEDPRPLETILARAPPPHVRAKAPPEPCPSAAEPN